MLARGCLFGLFGPVLDPIWTLIKWLWQKRYHMLIGLAFMIGPNIALAPQRDILLGTIPQDIVASVRDVHVPGDISATIMPERGADPLPTQEVTPTPYRYVLKPDTIMVSHPNAPEQVAAHGSTKQVANVGGKTFKIVARWGNASENSHEYRVGVVAQGYDNDQVFWVRAQDLPYDSSDYPTVVDAAPDWSGQ